MSLQAAENTELGLRERKKQRTRAAIMDAALELFTTRGFEAVSTAEIARAAEVSEATLFNYFRTKEDLVYDRLEAFWTGLFDAVEQRGEQGVVDAVESYILAGQLAKRTPEERERLVAIARMIATSPALRARERASYDHAAERLAGIIGRTTTAGGDALAAAHMLLAVHKALVAYSRAQLLAGTNEQLLSRRIAAKARSGFALLRRGLDI
jgi:AcrR family transcriptional regulator